MRVIVVPASRRSRDAFTEGRSDRVFNSWVTGFYETAIDGTYVTANPALARMFGYESAAEMTARVTDADLGCYVERGRRGEFVRLITIDGAVTEFESEVHRKDGSRFWMSEDAIAIRDAAGELVGFYGTVIDITARRQAGQTLRKNDERLRASEAKLLWLDTLRRELVANVSHDLRTPLTVLRGYLDYLVAHPSITARASPRPPLRRSQTGGFRISDEGPGLRNAGKYFAREASRWQLSGAS